VYAQKFVDDLSTSQLRQVYGAVKQAEHRYQADEDLDAALRRLRLIKPKLAYLSARDAGVEAFRERMIDRIDKTVEARSPIQLEYLFRSLEAFVAYHNYAEADDRPEFDKRKVPIDRDQIDQTAEEHARKYHDQDVKTSQLRQVYGEVKRAQSEFRQQGSGTSANQAVDKARTILYLLLPHLTYAAGRQEEMVEFTNDVRGWIYHAVDGDKAGLKKFFELMEAIVAYHKYYTETEDN
jgi:CRISPR type III-A-associated protein Csm2